MNGAVVVALVVELVVGTVVVISGVVVVWTVVAVKTILTKFQFRFSSVIMMQKCRSKMRSDMHDGKGLLIK